MVLINFIVIALVISLMVTYWFIRDERRGKAILSRVLAGASVSSRQ